MISSNYCYYDIETRSRNGINHGSDKYFEAGEYLIGTFARDDDKPQLWDRIGGEPTPRDLEDALRETQQASHMTDAQKDESFRAILNRGA